MVVLPPEQQTFDVMHDEAQRLNRLVEDLRTLSLVEAGELRLTPRPVSPEAMMLRVHSAHLAKAQEKDLEFDVAVAPSLPDVVADPDRMAQVLDNLVSNALRYTPENGRVLLTATQMNGHVRLTVKDSGPGLSASELAHVFDRFYRGDKARSRQEDGGTGLGLAIARSLVEANHGRIWAESKPGDGAEFIVELPIETNWAENEGRLLD